MGRDSASENTHEVVGVAMLARPGKIVLLHIDPAWRNSGIGSALLQALEQRARKSGVATLRVTSTFSARGFYESHGYAVLSVTNAPWGTGLSMARRLREPCEESADGCRCVAARKALRE